MGAGWIPSTPEAWFVNHIAASSPSKKSRGAHTLYYCQYFIPVCMAILAFPWFTGIRKGIRPATIVVMLIWPGGLQIHATPCRPMSAVALATPGLPCGSGVVTSLGTREGTFSVA